MNKDDDTPRSVGLGFKLAVAAFGAFIGFAAVYVTLGGPDNAPAGPQPSAATVETPSASDGSELAAFVRRPQPVELADIKFLDGAGQPISLSQFKGKTILLNLWATWCAPCRKEMPSLDRLQKDMGSDAFEVVALAVDRTGLEAAKKFLTDTKIENLKVYSDPTGKTGPELKAVGLPTTILIGKDGKELGRLPGPAEWDSAAAKALIREAVNAE